MNRNQSLERDIKAVVQAPRNEKFVVLDRRLRVRGESGSIRGAMGEVPDDKSYAVVRGEYTSDGTYWGPGRGRVVAVREFNPEGGFRWYMF